MCCAYRDEDWPHGLTCSQCRRPFHHGMPVAEQFAGLIDGTAVVYPVCAPCGLEHPVAA